jgi:hypothetical protein
LATAQSAKKIARKTLTTTTYLKMGEDGIQTFCGYTSVSFYFTDTRMILNTPRGSVNLRVIERTPDKWIGIDSKKNAYSIYTNDIEGKPAIIIIPQTFEGGLQAFAICESSKLCDNETPGQE